jgi:PPM family protein phosphatase
MNVKTFLDRLRHSKANPRSSRSKTSIPRLPGIAPTPAAQLEPRQLISGCGQSIGRQREHNEDSLFALSAASGGEDSAVPLGLFIIADGMGGYQYGEVASAAALRTLADYLLRRLLVYLANPSDGLQEPLQEMMLSAINEAQRTVMQVASGGGTTLTAALVLDQQVTIGHVGDSRAYALHPDGKVEVLTRDHTLVKRLEELGQISTEEAATHPQRNVLYRALGQGEDLEPDVFTIPFPQQGCLALCSDGLWGALKNEKLYDLVVSAPNLQEACQNLVAAANEAGGPDNISVILVQSIS